MFLAAGVLPTSIALTVAGLAVAGLSAAGARHDRIHPTEMAVFRAVNGLPGWLYWPLWLPMQLGNLVVGTLAGLAVAWGRGEVGLAIAVAAAAVLKLVAERVIRHRMTAFAEVRQRPGTSEPGAILRGADVPNSGTSFPSGHVILVAAIASVLSTGVPGSWIAAAWVAVALVMVGRVYVGAHNPLDVTAGLGAGMAVGGLLDMLAA